MISLSKQQFQQLIPNYILNIGEELQKNNFEAFLVGGSIRDILLGKAPQDFDIATNAYPDEISKIFSLWKEGSLKVDAKGVEQYSRRKIAERIAAILSSMAK